MKVLTGLLFLFGHDCGPDGVREMLEVKRDIAHLTDRIEREYMLSRIPTEDAIEMRHERREKIDELSAWTAACGDKLRMLPVPLAKPLK